MSKLSLLFCLMAPVVLLGGGCANGPNQTPIQAILRVDRERFAGTSSDFKVHVDTHAALLKSSHILQSALESPDLSEIKNLDVETLASSLVIEAPGESELLIVEIRHPHLSRQEAVLVLNEVIEAYQQNIVTKERLEKQVTLEKLRDNYQKLFEKVSRRSDEIRQLSEQRGSLDTEQVKLMQSLKLQELNHLHRKLTKLELHRIKWRKLERNHKLEIADAQLKLLASQYEDGLEEVRTLGATWGELEARRADLKALRSNLASSRSQMHALELELERPERVMVIQRAK